MYEFTLIKEYYLTQGRMKWIFDRIANDEGISYHFKDGKQYSSSTSRKTCALARISLENEPSKQSITIKYAGHVSIKTLVPHNVFKFLPVSKSAVEAKVSESIVKQLKREATESFQKYQESLKKWVSDR
jgi:hypothetical protein